MFNVPVETKASFDKTLYGKDKKGGIKVWSVKAIGDSIFVTHGKLDGAMQTKQTVCKPKNVGRANETTASEQAVSEAQSKYNKQIDKLYRPTVEELSEIDGLLPMLAHDYTKVGHRMEWPLWVSPKLDGVRCIARVDASGVTLTSRGGKPYLIPQHLSEELTELYNECGKDELILDGEIYLHGVPLQEIVSAIKKPNELTPSLEYHIFDLPQCDIPWEQRYSELESMVRLFGPNLHIVRCDLVQSKAAAQQILYHFMGLGYEGIMLRSPNGVYQYNHRSSDLMKWKEFQDTEVLVEFVEQDKNGEGVLNCVMKDKKTRVKCKMRGSHSFRSYEVQKTLVGRWITLRYQQLTADGVPQFPVGICVRECDTLGNPLV